ncbi:MAG: hypothetical protein LC657_14845 [Desulfobacteraceae bacterium]|nr:hypothetical protein [Desulfobacteraceae bacterium]
MVHGIIFKGPEHMADGIHVCNILENASLGNGLRFQFGQQYQVQPCLYLFFGYIHLHQGMEPGILNISRTRHRFKSLCRISDLISR